MRGLAKRKTHWVKCLESLGVKNDILRLSPYRVDHNHIVEVRPWRLNLTTEQLRKEALDRCHRN